MVGETGLDFFRTPDAAGQARQRESFAAHIAFAKAYDKTLVIHDRDAHDAVLDVLDAEGVPDRVVMHCFSGDETFARACLDRGAHLSFAGTVTFKANAHLRRALAITPLDRVLVETDAPFLTPVPLRGRPNASYLVPHTARVMAEVRAAAARRELCRALDANADAALGGPGPRAPTAPDVELADALARRRMVRRYDPDAAGRRRGARGRARRRPARPVGRLHPGRLAAGARRPERARTLLVGDREPAREDAGTNRWLDGMRTAPVLVLRADQPRGVPRPLRRARQGLDRPRRGALVGAVLVRRRGDGGHGDAAAGRRPGARAPASSASRPTASRPSTPRSGCRPTSWAWAWSSLGHPPVDGDRGSRGSPARAAPAGRRRGRAPRLLVSRSAARLRPRS